jgi:hypothetical protein
MRETKAQKLAYTLGKQVLQYAPMGDVRCLKTVVNTRENTAEILVATTTPAGEDRILEAFAEHVIPNTPEGLTSNFLFIPEDSPVFQAEETRYPHIGSFTSTCENEVP